MDLNSDLGESFGVYTLGADAELFPLITSANIACGFHAGDPQVMERTVALARAHGVAIGAHPGYPDLAGFGRRAMEAGEIEIENFVLYQIGALAGFCRAQGAPLRHVKPHGALYNMASRDLKVARAIARAVARYDPQLVLVGLANSALIDAAHELGIQAASEGFCDRAYNPDGTLRSRREPGAVHATPERAAAQAVQLARDHNLTAYDGTIIPLEVDTLCLHGDTPHAVEYARAIRRALAEAGIEIKAL
ncbi:MAG: 5-oxoprolinase subunit PxpA [Anaerolineae bacterium]